MLLYTLTIVVGVMITCQLVICMPSEANVKRVVRETVYRCREDICYYAVSSYFALNHERAEAACKPGHLASIHRQDEQDMLVELVNEAAAKNKDVGTYPGFAQFWLGLTLEWSGQTFKHANWTDGSPMDWPWSTREMPGARPWKDGAPDNHDDQEKTCTFIYANQGDFKNLATMWDERNCDNEDSSHTDRVRGYVCQTRKP